MAKISARGFSWNELKWPRLDQIWPILLLNLALIVAYFVKKWPPVNLFLFYFIETFVIGVWNIIKMYLVYRREGASAKPKNMSAFGLMLFIFVHYTFFGVIQFILFMGFTTMGGNAWEHIFGSNVPDPFNLIAIGKGILTNSKMQWVILLIVGSISLHELLNIFFTPNYLANNMEKQGFQPYARILVQQFVVILGGFFVAIPVLREYSIFFLLIIIKILVDLFWGQVGGVSIKENV